MAKGKPRKSVAVPPPYGLAMVICDAIWRDPGSGKRSILGCFSTIFARQFPAVHPIMAVYAALTDGHGKVSIKLQAVDVDGENEPLFVNTAEAEFPDPRVIVEMDIHLRDLKFPAPGEYRFQLFANDQFLLERRLMVVQLPAAE
jgi:Family of unknown function (DUF6941)